MDRQIEHRRPDIVVMEKNTNKCLITGVACPVDNNLILKRNEKLDKYSELRLEIARMWDKETLNSTNNYSSTRIHTKRLIMQLEKLGISYVDTL